MSKLGDGVEGLSLGSMSLTGDCHNDIQWEQLPDPALLVVFTFLEVEDILCVSRVCKHWRVIAKSQTLWKRKRLSFLPDDIWEELELEAQRFARILMFAPTLNALELGLQDSNPDCINSALSQSDCQIQSLTLTVGEYDSVSEAFLLKHSELSELTLKDYCRSPIWAKRISKAISSLKIKCLNINDSNLLHYKGVHFQGLRLQCLEYCPSEFTDEIAEPYVVLAEIISCSQDCLRVVCLRAPYREVFLSLSYCTALEDVDVIYGDGILEFLENASRLSLNSLVLCNLPVDNDSIFMAMASLKHLQNLNLSCCLNFPGFLALYPMICSLKTLTLSNVMYVGSSELKNLISIFNTNLKIILSDCPCSNDGSYWSCRSRILPKIAHSCGIQLIIENHEGLDDTFDYGFKPIYDCQCERRRPNL